MKFLLMFLFLNMQVYAGEKGGNGGDGIICRNSSGQVISAELLDYYEARVMRDIETSKLSNQVDVNENLSRLFLSLEKKSPVRAQIYRDLYAVFF